MTRRFPLGVRWWALGIAVAGAWALALAAIAAPLLEAHRLPLAEPLYGLLRHFCHQRPSRSWFLLGSNLALCARAFSLYATVALAGTFLLASARARAALGGLPLGAAPLLAAPIVVDGAGQLAGLWLSTNPLRAVTACLGGLAALRLILPSAPDRSPTAPGRAPALRRAVAALVVASLLLASPAAGQGAGGVAGRVGLKAGTPVFLVFPTPVSSESVAEGQNVSLRVIREVRVDGVTVIASGASATARVDRVRRPAGWGSPGALTVFVSDVETVDGQNVPLRATQEAVGQDKQTGAAVTGIIAGLLCLPSALWGFAISGDEGRIAAGTEVKAFTEADALVAVDAPRARAR